jgi:hypothetical protein
MNHTDNPPVVSEEVVKNNEEVKPKREIITLASIRAKKKAETGKDYLYPEPVIIDAYTRIMHFENGNKVIIKKTPGNNRETYTYVYTLFNQTLMMEIDMSRVCRLIGIFGTSCNSLDDNR